ncbi:FkbM family methyltransferase [Roseococcus sp. SDR]|uniref:FkbM family methyltransferase n=1 Tax=Roseococcus sp. SDR TaxID=2835532 RepID=UPI001BCFAE17|nr:FkbM family methyltransferase [Roseococcus sp. SDR]MBS7788461.1 FkbM family methyltransferase [Roseococcus sp. SDR]MBV1843775.1 FkbM family methyltransferase [Roseococcus sp. SDR]
MMRPERLEALRFAGYAPRTLLDVGAHLGHFTQGLRQVFPDCVPTLIEPNPHCLPALAATGHEVLGFAASHENGEAELFLTREWLQSTGTSLYRENTPFFRDEVLIRTPVPRRRLDDVLAGRRFDLVKIDTQGAELDVLLGGQAVLRQADYILIEVSLVEYNQGGARAEEVFAALSALGFRSAEVAEFHRLRGVQDGALLQLDFLFEREVPRPSQALRGPVAGLPAWLAERRARCADFAVLAVGEAGFDADVGFGAPGAPLTIAGDPARLRDWDALLRLAARQGRFPYAVARLPPGRLAEASLLLDMLPRVAAAGVVEAMPGQNWHWEAGEGGLRLAPGRQPMPAFLQWRGAIAFDTQPARKAA